MAVECIRWDQLHSTVPPSQMKAPCKFAAGWANGVQEYLIFLHDAIRELP